MAKVAIVWFRNDRRLADNPALLAAAERADHVVPLFILEDDRSAAWRHGGGSRWWLHHSLAASDAALRRLGSRLILRRGPADEAVAAVARETGATAVYWNRRYDRDGRAIDMRLKSGLRSQGIEAESFNAALLFEPWTLKTKAGGPFKVYTPFYKACLAMPAPGAPSPAPRRLAPAEAWPSSESLDAWELLPTAPDWAGGLRDAWTPGETAALDRLASFLDTQLDDYTRRRDRPDVDGTSRLSPHLANGEIGPRQIWHATRLRADSRNGKTGAEKFLSEVIWREFAHHLLYHHESLPEANFQPAFDAFPWRDDPDALRAWQRGRTGIPIVDAGMRQLWQTGWMHNRVRMIVGSFLVKNLLQHWRHGEDWFWDTLVDADLANNAFGWQWIAGSGADAAPYFRVFNPVLQGERFDPDGDYVRTYVPELARLPESVIHKPWTADNDTLKQAGVAIGKTYPAPIVDLAASRQRALDAFTAIKRSEG
ncbi:MAG TPA: deoxyribodipyrimidine photo-lyase [Vineibacter sp.]|nr:deoxyribodipyrimidine photo-lyase [Vineibacter sp.]